MIIPHTLTICLFFIVMLEYFGRSEKMKKKLMFYTMLIIVGLVVLAFLHFQSKPEEMPVVARNKVTGQLQYDEVNEFVYNSDDVVYLFFFSSEDSDSQLVIDNMLNPILKENNLTGFDELYYVDLADLPSTVGTKYTKNQWNFYDYPTFIGMKIENNQAIISDVLEWSSTNPYTIDDVRTWLQEHKITQN